VKSEIRNPKSERSPKAEIRRVRSDARSSFGPRISDFGLRICISSLLLSTLSARAAFVSESPAEFLTSGDFNGDGLPDVLVLDRLTGNARVGYQSPGGALSWSPAFTTGMENVTGVGIGKFVSTNRDAIAATAPDFNRISLLDVPIPGSNSVPVIIVPGVTATNAAGGLGPHGLAGLPAPFGTNAPFDRLLCASSQNPTPAARLNLLGLNAGTVVAAPEYAGTAPLERVNPLPLASNLTFAAGLTRGATNDALHVWQFTNSPGVVTALSNLPPGSDYAFGRFNDEPLPRFWSYVPGGTNVAIHTFATNGNSFAFGAATILNLTQAVERVYIIGTNNDSSAILHYGDCIQGVRLPGGTPSFAAKHCPNAGEIFTGIAALSDGKFVLFSAPTGTVSSLTAHVMSFDGTNYTQISSTNLLPVTTPGTRATVWLFQSEPFTNAAASLIASLNVPDWSSGVTGLPGALAVRVENDSGTASGLGSPATNNLGAPPAGTAYALPEQYRSDISFFSYAPPRAAEPVVVSIAPPPGDYGAPIQISFIKQNPAHEVRYRIGAKANWDLYAAPFPLTNDATIQFYGSTTNGTRGRIQFASYSVGNIVVPPEPLIAPPGSETNPPPPVNPNATPISPGGTVVYGRRGSNTVPAIWVVNLDGSGDTRVTDGLRPRVSRDGHYMSFLRENDPATNQFSLWVRELATGQEARLHTSSNRYVGHDWTTDNTEIIFDNECFVWRIGLTGAVPQLLLPGDCQQGAPSVNPLDGRLALQVIFPGSTGLYLAPSNAAPKANLNLSVLSPRWPAWSPNGQRIALANDPDVSTAIDAGHDLFVVSLGAQTNVFQITALAGGTDGFPNGAVWTPNGNKLVAAGRIGGVKGLWVIPLAADGSACHCPPQLLPTSAGDDIDFAGGVVAASVNVSYANLGLFIRADPSVIVVYWSTNYDGFALESATEIPAGLSWSPVTGPYFRAGPNFEYRESRAALAARKYFRLRYPGVLLLTPGEPMVGLRLEPSAAVLNWPLNYVGYTLEATTNLSPPVLWTPLGGPYLNTNGVFEYRRNLPGPPQEFYRLRWP
jgi:hypothetical protein